MTTKNIFRWLFAPCFSVLVFCETAHAEFTEKNVAVVQILNKAAGKTQNIDIPVGQTVSFEKLNITVRSCKQTAPFEAENFYAFIEISKTTDSTKIFSNWMDRNNPGRQPVQNPDYDIWLARCE